MGILSAYGAAITHRVTLSSKATTPRRRTRAGQKKPDISLTRFTVINRHQYRDFARRDMLTKGRPPKREVRGFFEERLLCGAKMGARRTERWYVRVPFLKLTTSFFGTGSDLFRE